MVGEDRATATPMPSNEFFMFYYVLTGVHLFHVVLGLIDPGRRGPRIAQPAPATLVHGRVREPLYWHMIDLLWVVIFGVLYLMR